MARMAITKNDRARVIVAALYNMSALPDADDARVKRLARRNADQLERQHKIALRVIEQRA